MLFVFVIKVALRLYAKLVISVTSSIIKETFLFFLLKESALMKKSINI